MLHVGVIGVGRIGIFHARTLAALPSVSGLTVADADAARAEAAADELGARAATIDELVSSVDAVAIAAATGAHVELIRRAVRAGRPVFCEKPVAHDLATLTALIEEVEAAGTLVQIGFQRRFDAGYRAARE